MKEEDSSGGFFHYWEYNYYAIMCYRKWIKYEKRYRNVFSVMLIFIQSLHRTKNITITIYMYYNIYLYIIIYIHTYICESCHPQEELNYTCTVSITITSGYSILLCFIKKIFVFMLSLKLSVSIPYCFVTRMDK